MSDDKTADAPLDPKQRMKIALDAKKAAAHVRNARVNDNAPASGGPQAQAGGKRVFRRKAGG